MDENTLDHITSLDVVFMNAAKYNNIKIENKELNEVNEEMDKVINEMTTKISDLTKKNEELFEKNEELFEKNEELLEKNKQLEEDLSKLDKIERDSYNKGYKAGKDKKFGFKRFKI